MDFRYKTSRPQEVSAVSSGHPDVTMGKSASNRMSAHKTKVETLTFEDPCPIRGVLDRIGDQWSLLVLQSLHTRRLRFNELMRDIDDISKQMLSRTLKHLEQDGFVRRTVFAEVPPRVEYELTELGSSFLVPMKALVTWADTNHSAIREARKGYDKK
jgi:DNA-binding HxlR family transcriptional regulator